MKKHCQYKNQHNILAFQHKQFVIGVTKTRYNILKLLPDKEEYINHSCKLLLMIFLLLKKKKITFMQELVPKSKITIFKDKSAFSNTTILTTNLLQIVLQELISKEKVLKPFWNQQCKEISTMLWLPTETDYQDSDSSLSNGSSNQTMENSQFWIRNLKNPEMKNSQKTCYPSSMSLTVDKWEKEDIKLKTRMIRLYPTRKQRKILNDWKHTNRYVYNKTLAAIKTDLDQKINFQDLRNKLVTNTVKTHSGKIQNPNVKNWETKTPKEIRAYAVKDVVSAYKSAWSNFRNGNISKFDLSFRKKKSYSSSMTIQKKSITYKDEERKLHIYKTFFDSSGIQIGNRTAKKLEIDNITFDHDSKIVYSKGKYYLCVPIPVQKPDNLEKTKKKGVIALDPGVRTFQTGYSDSEIVEFKRDTDLLKKLKDKIKLLQEHKKYGTIQRYYDRIGNLVRDLHWRTIGYLTNHYDAILLPSFESQDMVKKSKNRTLNGMMNMLQHYKFKQRLRFKCNEIQNTKLYIVSEAYTTQTCGKCGVLNKQIGSNKVFSCVSESCDYVCDRDFNAARNILLKHLKK